MPLVAAWPEAATTVRLPGRPLARGGVPTSHVAEPCAAITHQNPGGEPAWSSIERLYESENWVECKTGEPIAGKPRPQPAAIHTAAADGARGERFAIRAEAVRSLPSPQRRCYGSPDHNRIRAPSRTRVQE